MRINRQSTLLIVFLTLCGTANAQYPRIFVFAGPGGIKAPTSTSSYSLGGGVEQLLEHGIGARGDVAAALPTTDTRNQTLGMISTDLTYHSHKEHNVKFDPYGFGGYTFAFRHDTANLGNFGGGALYWFGENQGVLFELRDDAGKLQGTTNHFWSVRFGLTWR